MGSLGEGLTVAQRIQRASGKKEFFRLMKTKPQGFEWVLCAYGYGSFHQLHCGYDVKRCMDCKEEVCGHVLSKCDKCNEPVCNICAWSIRLNMKNKSLATKCHEITLCGQCKVELSKKKKKNFWSNIWNPWGEDDDWNDNNNTSYYFDM